MESCIIGFEELTFEFCSLHSALVASFLADPIYKSWRAQESASVVAAVNEFTCTPTEHQFSKKFDFNRMDTRLSRENSECSSQQALSSIRTSDVQSVASSSSWLTQFIAVMELFPVSFALCKVKKILVAHNGADWWSHSFQVVYVNRCFEALAVIPRKSIVSKTMECFLTQLGQFCLVNEIISQNSSHESSRDSSDASRILWSAACLQSVDVGYIRATFPKMENAAVNQVDVVMKPLFDINGETTHWMAFFLPVPNNNLLDTLMRKDSITEVRRHAAFLQSLPHTVTEYESTTSPPTLAAPMLVKTNSAITEQSVERKAPSNW